jgi:hypothetical protein
MFVSTLDVEEVWLLTREITMTQSSRPKTFRTNNLVYTLSPTKRMGKITESHVTVRIIGPRVSARYSGEGVAAAIFASITNKFVSLCFNRHIHASYMHPRTNPDIQIRKFPNRQANKFSRNIASFSQAYVTSQRGRARDFKSQRKKKKEGYFIVGKRLASGETEAVGLETTVEKKATLKTGLQNRPSSESNRGHENIPTVRGEKTMGTINAITIIR